MRSGRTVTAPVALTYGLLNPLAARRIWRCSPAFMVLSRCAADPLPPVARMSVWWWCPTLMALLGIRSALFYFRVPPVG